MGGCAANLPNANKFQQTEHHLDCHSDEEPSEEQGNVGMDAIKTILSPSPALEKTKIGKLRRPQLRRPAWQSLRQTPPNSKTLELLLDIRHLFVSLHFEAKLFVAILGQDTVGCVDDKQIFLRIHGLLFIPLAQASRLWQRAHEPPCTRMECMTQAMAHS